MEEQRKKEQWREFIDDTFDAMDSSREELGRLLYPVFHDKTKYVNGKLMKDCFKQIGYMLRAQTILRKELEKLR